MSKNTLINLYLKRFKSIPDVTSSIKANASERKLFFMQSGKNICVGVINENTDENTAFIEFSKSFKKAGFNVPDIYETSEDLHCYILEYLGNTTLMDFSINDKGRNNFKILCKQALYDLLRFQTIGKDIINFNYCYQTRSFDSVQIKYDENKFIKYFLKEFYPFLINDNMTECLNTLNEILVFNKEYYFMYRDFQPRNIMIYENNSLYYLDYQSGRLGPLQYDVVSFLYSGSSGLNEPERTELLDYYINLLKKSNIDTVNFMKYFYYYGLIRLIQMLGSYGYLHKVRKDKSQISKIIIGLDKINQIAKNIEEKEIRNFIFQISRQTK